MTQKKTHWLRTSIVIMLIFAIAGLDFLPQFSECHSVDQCKQGIQRFMVGQTF